MPRYTVAYSTLVKRLGEVDELSQLARSFEKLHTRPDDLSKVRALGRASVVLLCSHIEGYIEDIGSLAIDRIQDRNVKKDSLPLEFRYYLSLDNIRRIQTSQHPDTTAEAVLDFMRQAGAIWDTSREFSQIDAAGFNSSFSSPTHRKIRQFFRRFGFKEYDGRMRRKLQTKVTCINTVNNVVHQRNAIAHGDQRVRTSSADLRQMREDVKLYCRTTDEVVGDWFREEICPIR